MTLKRCLFATTPVRKMIRIEICLVKFPHSPILHYAFSSWIEKTNDKNNTLPLGKQICFTVWRCAEILPTI